MGELRGWAEIKADTDQTRAKLRAVNQQLGTLLPVAQNSPIGRELHSERSELVAKLEALKDEMIKLAMSGVKE